MSEYSEYPREYSEYPVSTPSSPREYSEYPREYIVRWDANAFLLDR